MKRVTGTTVPRTPRKRTTFRHGHLPEALVDAALRRLDAEGAAALSLRELARDVGVNHRAVYRHLPDKLALLARVAEQGYRRMLAYMEKEARPEIRGEAALVAAAFACFRFAQDHPGLATLMAGPRLNDDGAFPALEALITEVLMQFARGFVELGTDPAVARRRGAYFLFALFGIVEQIRHGRLAVAPKHARDFVADISRMLIKGFR